ncbi:MAG: MaoC family dehydratase N-terminal domain-containing protein [Hyphomicrobiales bacterium]|nr:MaoC family dehydratase N-terminal domain-containing protein [Hyphomicrobiales bacterium]MCP5374431.1 MaoC family dehydratase N-terminal domain-containing protein [Hyphomicrobiales bacterium]
MGTARFEDLAVGQEIPPLTKPAVDRLQLALFAGASADHNPIHVDEGAARGGGLPGVIVHGMLNMAFLGQVVTNWVPVGRLRAFATRFAAMAYPGDVITCRGRIAAVDGAGRTVDLALTAENQNGEVLLAGTATVAFP